jgi:phenylpyruvate tautomerase PptA (4-oxalocrotonate tautomerase family)
MNFHQWDLMIVTPTVIVKLLEANGVVFDNEEIEDAKKKEIAKGINDKIATNLETLVKSLISFRDKRSS